MAKTAYVIVIGLGGIVMSHTEEDGKYPFFSSWVTIKSTFSLD